MTGFARMCRAVMAWLARQAGWVKVVAWALLFPVLGAVALVAQRPYSALVRRGAVAWFAVLTVLVAVSPPGADDGEGPVAGPTSPSPTVSPSPVGSASADSSPTPTATSPSPAVPATSSPSPSPASPPTSAPPTAPPTAPTSAPPTTAAESAGPRGDDAPVAVQGRVVDIVDGDTIDLVDGTRVRLAIADTPEVHGGVETCGPEASDFTGAFLAGQTVAVYRPADAPATDDFGRTVGEVVRVTDGASLNVALVAAGLARIDERFTSEDPDLTGRLRAAADAAETAACAPQPEAAPPPPPPTGSVGGGHTGRTDGGWDCHPAYRECLPQGGDLDCGDVGHAVALTGDEDPYRLDGRSTTREDGAGCESYGPWSASSTYPYY